mmetsp:Transcript_21402/g.36494  ORF Transcript_21402/g.36494 Transcript_21402/m.36494 type:complete len:229 (-) Transcript_21402:576-1262(-)
MFQVLKHLVPQLFQRFTLVVVGQARVHLDVKGVVGTKVLKVLVGGDGVLHELLTTEKHAGLISPASCHVFNLVAATAKHQERDPKGGQMPVAGGMPLDAEVEHPQLVLGQAVRAALQHDGPWLVGLHDLVHDGFEKKHIGLVVHAILQGYVHTVVLSRPHTDVSDVSTAWEKIVPMLVEGNRHHSICGEEGLLHPVPMVHININVEHSVVILEKLQDREHHVIHVAEA